MKIIMQSHVILMLRKLFIWCFLILVTACDNNSETNTAIKEQVDTATQSKLILVSGATGKQGGSVARELLTRGYHVRGLTRNPDSERARNLLKLGVEMVKGDFNDVPSLNRAMQGVYGVFSVQDFWEHGQQAEIVQGINFANAARRAGVNHFIYSSVASANQNTGIPHFDSKYTIEEYIKTLQLPYTIFRPVAFMENWEYVRADIEQGIIYGPQSANTQHQQISVRDIGRFVAEAFDNPADWLGKSIDIAGDQYNKQEIAQIFSRVTGRKIKYLQVPWDEFEKDQGEAMTVMGKWFEDVGYSVDVENLRAQYPWLMTLEQYLQENAWQ